MAKATILVVDDEIEIVKALSLRLKAAGYTVLSAHNGSQATQKARCHAPNLVILDIGMPCGNGHSVARQLAQNRATASIPIIFLTASPSAEDRAKAHETGIVAYLTKPFRSQELLAVVTRALSTLPLSA